MRTIVWAVGRGGVGCLVREAVRVVVGHCWGWKAVWEDSQREQDALCWGGCWGIIKYAPQALSWCLCYTLSLTPSHPWCVVRVAVHTIVYVFLLPSQIGVGGICRPTVLQALFQPHLFLNCKRSAVHISTYIFICLKTRVRKLIHKYIVLPYFCLLQMCANTRLRVITFLQWDVSQATMSTTSHNPFYICWLFMAGRP